MNTTSNPRSGEKGFTLVELAIVMIIIGLLIGGILKGQELIANARVASAVTKIKAVDAALNTFQDSYGGKPGDILAPNSRLSGCTLRCNTVGNGNGQIGGGPDAANAAGSENIVAWAQLAAADLIGGIRDTAVADNLAANVNVPGAEIPGQIFVGFAAGLTGLAMETTTVNARSGHYLAIYNGVPATAGATQAVASATTVSLTPNQATRIDQKIDDGLPNTGSVIAMGATGGGTTSCATGADATAANNVYVGANTSSNCGLYVRVQQ